MALLKKGGHPPPGANLFICKKFLYSDNLVLIVIKLHHYNCKLKSYIVF